jgi:putative phage-type endonuclease
MDCLHTTMSIFTMEDKIKKLIQEYGSNDQRTQAWHLKRGEMLTASEIHKALADATPALKHEIIMSKLVPRPRTEGAGPRALVWGTRLEHVAKEVYCILHGGIDIVDTSCIPHPQHSFLGASPDGIIVTKDPEDFRYGKLVEFKCPISREFSQDSPIPTAYYHQMQLQLECTGLDECEYVEMGFKDVSYSMWMDSKVEYKSFYAVHEDDIQLMYKPISDLRDVATWRKEVLGEDAHKWNLVFWTLNKTRQTTVPRDPVWLSTNLESFQEVWKQVQEHRLNGTLPEHPKDKKTLTLTI